jgi:hypothetical protein
MGQQVTRGVLAAFGFTMEQLRLDLAKGPSERLSLTFDDYYQGAAKKDTGDFALLGTGLETKKTAKSGRRTITYRTVIKAPAPPLTDVFIVSAIEAKLQNTIELRNTVWRLDEKPDVVLYFINPPADHRTWQFEELNRHATGTQNVLIAIQSAATTPNNRVSLNTAPPDITTAFERTRFTAYFDIFRGKDDEFDQKDNSEAVAEIASLIARTQKPDKPVAMQAFQPTRPYQPAQKSNPMQLAPPSAANSFAIPPREFRRLVQKGATPAQSRKDSKERKRLTHSPVEYVESPGPMVLDVLTAEDHARILGAIRRDGEEQTKKLENLERERKERKQRYEQLAQEALARNDMVMHGLHTMAALGEQDPKEIAEKQRREQLKREKSDARAKQSQRLATKAIARGDMGSFQSYMDEDDF